MEGAEHEGDELDPRFCKLLLQRLRADWERVVIFWGAFIEADSYCYTGLFKEGVETVVRIVQSRKLELVYMVVLHFSSPTPSTPSH